MIKTVFVLRMPKNSRAAQKRSNARIRKCAKIQKSFDELLINFIKNSAKFRMLVYKINTGFISIM